LKILLKAEIYFNIPDCWFSTRCYVTTSGYIGTEKMNRITEFNKRVIRNSDN